MTEKEASLLSALLEFTVMLYCFQGVVKLDYQKCLFFFSCKTIPSPQMNWVLNYFSFKYNYSSASKKSGKSPGRDLTWKLVIFNQSWLSMNNLPKLLKAFIPWFIKCIYLEDFWQNKNNLTVQILPLKELNLYQLHLVVLVLRYWKFWNKKTCYKIAGFD